MRERSRIVRLPQLMSDAGIVPVSRLLAAVKSVRPSSCPMLSGIGPESALLRVWCVCVCCVFVMVGWVECWRRQSDDGGRALNQATTQRRRRHK